MATATADTIEPITVLGVDQSTTATGLCVIKWHPVSGPDVLYARTVEPSGMQEIYSALCDVFRYTSYRPVAMAREQGFFSAKTPEAGLAIERSGGWIEMAIWTLSARAMMVTSPTMYRMMAIEWRRAVWGAEYAKLPADVAKDHSVQFFLAHVIPQIAKKGYPEIDADAVDDHMADAFGIACCGGQKHHQRMLEEHYTKNGGSRSDGKSTDTH